MEFLTDAQVAGYGRFVGVPSRSDLERFFVLDSVDRDLLGDRRGDHNRLGLMVQATTVRYIGMFLKDPVDVSWLVVEYVARGRCSITGWGGCDGTWSCCRESRC